MIKLDEKRVFNKRILGFTADMLVFIALTLCLFRADTVLGVLGIVLAVIQLVFILISPVCYVFTEDSLTIKYFFGVEEIIPWQKVSSIREHHNFHYKRYIFLKAYKIDYRSEVKSHFIADGTVSKNKQITKLLKEYCPKRFEDIKKCKR